MADMPRLSLLGNAIPLNTCIRTARESRALLARNGDYS